MKILEIRNLCKVYGKGETEVHALRNVSFDIDQGEFVAIVGPSGSGKSTLMHILGGVDVPTLGTVNISGTDISGLDETRLAIFRRRHIGLIYQFYNLIPILNVEENMTLPILLDKKKPDRKLLLELVDKLGLSDRLKHLSNQLSGGQQQRVAIARALVNDPVIILADEATGNLDTRTSYEIMMIFQELNRQGKTIAFVTHEPDIATFSGRTITLRDGLIKKDVINENVQDAKAAFEALPPPEVFEE